MTFAKPCCWRLPSVPLKNSSGLTSPLANKDFNRWSQITSENLEFLQLVRIVSNEYVGKSKYSRFEISDFVFDNQLELLPDVVSWYFSKSSNVLCSDQGLILSGMWRKHYFHFPSRKNIENIVVEDGKIPYFQHGIALHTRSFSEFSKFCTDSSSVFRILGK